MIKRNIYSKLKKYIKKKEILALIGSRQVGKTTLMKQLFEEDKRKKKFISFDSETDLNLFENNIEDFIKLHVKNYDILFIDEFQYAKLGGKQLKYIYDTYGTKVIISGSSAPELTIQSLSYLVGRVFIFTIYPISFTEYLTYTNKDLLEIYNNKVSLENKHLFDDFFKKFLQFGTYPQVITQKSEEDKKFVLNSLTSNYLLKEIKDILAYKSSFEFQNLLKSLALQDGTLLNKSNLGSDLGININKITEMINVLEQTFIVTKLRPVQSKKIKELIKSPKIYFLDYGFKNSLIDNFKPLELRIDKGEILESFILSELLKLDKKVKFYNYKNSSEVDFIIEENNELIGIEVKSNLTGLKVERGLREFIKKFSPKKIYIFNLNQEGIINIEDVEVEFLHHLNVAKIFGGDRK